MTAKEIKKVLDEAVTDYIEAKDGISRLSERIDKINNADCFETLTQAGMSDLIAIIDKAGDIEYETSQYGYNPKDAGSVQRVLQDYYEKIGSK